MFALVDGNKIYVSCERVFRPSLNGRPVIVLSNNDGCAIARSNEAKDLGIKMGAPWFQIRHLEVTAGLVALSANFPLYGDMSDRMMSLAAALGPTQEIYSIECFIGLQGVRDVTLRAWAIRSRILQWIGIPCGIGIAPTNTLAKLANHIAKTAERKPGSYPAELAQVCNLAELSSSQLQSLLERAPVTDVWGIGPRLGAQLIELGIGNVQALRGLDPATARRRWSITLERTVRELQGYSCIEMEHGPVPKQMIACTRSFGQTITELEPLVEAVSEFATRAAQKLRQQRGRAGQLQVFAHTSPHRPGPARPGPAHGILARWWCRWCGRPVTRGCWWRPPWQACAASTSQAMTSSRRASSCSIWWAPRCSRPTWCWRRPRSGTPNA